MIRWFCQGLQGWVPMAARAMPRPAASSSSWARRSPIFAAASAKLVQRPVRTSTSDEISSPTRWASSGVPWAAAWSSSNRLTRPSVSGSRTANSSSTARVKSCPLSYASCAKRICSSGLSFWVSPTAERTLVGEGLEQSHRDTLPAPACDYGAAGGFAHCAVIVLWERQQCGELAGEVVAVSGCEARELAVLSWVLGLEPFGDLGQPGMAGDERQRAAAGSFRGNHPEGLGENRRHDRHPAERDQVDEVPVLQRPGEQGSRRRDPLQLVAVVAEADDDRSRLRLDFGQRVEEDVDAFVVQQLAEVENGRLVALEPGLEPLGVSLVREAFLGIAGVGRVAARLLEQAPERGRPGFGLELVDVDAGRHLVDAIDVADDLLEDGANVSRADEDGLGLCEAVSSPPRKLRVAAHRVLELGAVRLDGVGRGGGRRDGPAQEDVVREDEVGRQLAADRGRVGVDVALAFSRGQVLEKPRLEPFVAVEDEHRQEVAGQLRADDPGAAEVIRGGGPLLADADDLVAGLSPRPRAGRGVHVRGRPAEQVPVPEDDLHPGSLIELARVRRGGPKTVVCPPELPQTDGCGREVALPLHGSPGPSGQVPGRLGQVEIERVQKLDGRIGRVDLHVVRVVEQRFRVIEDDLDASDDQLVGDLLRALRRNRDHADGDVLLADRLPKLP